MNFIEQANWRYATKQFDATKSISTVDLDNLKEAVRLSVSSFGLQAYKIMVVENKAIREQLVEHSWNQRQVADASHLFVFCNYTNLSEIHADDYMQLMAKTREVSVESLADFNGMLKGFINNMSEDILTSWMHKQIYIAMTNLLNAAAELKIDACPMEGFVAEKYNEILGLDAKNLNASVIVPVGYRHADDKYSGMVKVRKATEDLFETI